MFDSFGFGSSTHEPITFVEAQKIAEKLCILLGVPSVELYGSIARAGEGNDIDLLLIIDNEALYQKFIERVKTHIELHAIGANAGAYVRECAIGDVFGEAYADFIRVELMQDARADGADLVDYLDMFVMPMNWRERIDEIQGNLPHDDPCFIRNIAADARIIATRTT